MFIWDNKRFRTVFFGNAYLNDRTVGMFKRLKDFKGLPHMVKYLGSIHHGGLKATQPSNHIHTTLWIHIKKTHVIIIP